MNEVSLNKKNIYNILSLNREILMGLSILFVSVYHANFSFMSSNRIINSILHCVSESFQGGVDIFVILSGFFIVRSLEHNSKKKYFINRLKRIYPIWVLVLIADFFLPVHKRIPKINEAIGHLVFTQMWAGQGYPENWYVYFITVAYLLAPIIYELFKEAKCSKKMLLLLLGLCVLLCIGFLKSPYMIEITRLPEFILGVYLGLYSEKFYIRKKENIGVFIIFVLFYILLLVILKYCPKEYLRPYGFLWYPNWFVSVTVILLIGQINLFLPHCILIDLIRAFLMLCGKNSLEILLVHALLCNLYMQAEKNNILSGILLCCGVICGCFVGVLINKTRVIVEKNKCL